MPDIDIIHQLEDAFGIRLKQVTPEAISQKEDWGNLQGLRAYAVNEDSCVLGLSLDYLDTIPAISEYLLSLQHLTFLSLRGSDYEDYAFLQKLPHVTTLDLSYTEVSDLTILKEMKNLTSLDLGGTKASDLSILKEMKNLTTLDLSDTEVSDLTFLNELKNLTTLDLSSAKVSDLTFLKELKNLTTLNLWNTKVSDFTFLNELKNLTTLYLSDTGASDFTFLNELKNLTTLYLSDTGASDFTFLKELKNLTTLYLWNTKVSDLTFLKELKNLTTLYLWNTKVSDLTFLKELKNLTTLNLSDTGASDLTFLKELKNLTTLNLNRTKVSDLTFLKELKNLTTLDLNRTKVSDLTFLKELKNLITLNLQDTEVSDLSPLMELHGLYLLEITPERITNPPRDIAAQGWKSIRNYFRQLAAQGEERLHEAKIIIVGEPDAGKTTLMRKLFDENTPVPDTSQKSTLGIDINLGKPAGLRLPFPGKPGIIQTANLWDFGGHDIQYMLHQYFLRPDSLYVLVSDDRKANTRFDYWFQIIRLLGCEETKPCPVIVVLNKINYESVMNYDHQKYQREFPELTIKQLEVDFAQNDKRWENLKEFIIKELAGLPIMDQVVPGTWKPIREELERRKTEKYISIKDFFQLCAQHGLDQESDALVMLHYFDRIGVALNFKKDENLCATVFLDPNWITKAIYLVLSDKNVESSRGKFQKDWLFQFWAEQGYNFDEQNLLLRLMLKNNFDICYAIPANQDTFIVPMLLSNIRPDYRPKQGKKLLFRYQYAFMPRGIISRLIVRLNSYIENNLVWKDGVVLQDQNTGCRAEITQNEIDRIIDICITGDDINHRKDMLAKIGNEIDYIHRTAFPGIHCSQMVACNCSQCGRAGVPDYFALQTLQEFVAKKQKYIQCRKSTYNVSIELLVGAVYPTNDLQRGEFYYPYPYIAAISEPIDDTTPEENSGNIAVQIADIEAEIEATEMDYKDLQEQKEYLDKKAKNRVNLGVILLVIVELGLMAAGILAFFNQKTKIETWAKMVLIVIPGLLAAGEIVFHKPFNEFLLDKIKERTSKKLYLKHRFSLNKYNAVKEKLDELRGEKKELLARARNI
jgi:GTPase SAR1 family protein